MKWGTVKKRSPAQWIAALVIMVVIIIGAAVLADHPPENVSDVNSSYITSEKYEEIKSGMTYDQVKEIIGSDGKNIFESGDKGTESYQISYMWQGNNGGEATISFSGQNQLKVQLKSQSGLK